MKSTTLFLSLLPLLVALPLRAALQAGNAFPAFSVQDQHEVPYTLERGVRYVIVSFDMPSGKATNKYLESHDKSYLEEHNAVFLSNIYGMPWVGRKFALPKMRKYEHRILLADSEHLLDDYPREEDKVTVIELDDQMRIVAVSFWDPKSGQDPFAE